MSVQPVLRSPLTDLTGSILNHQYFGQCGQREMDMVECMEAYGVHQGRVKCKDLIEDFHECFSYDKQIFRYYAMNAERKRQFKAGERQALYSPPPKMDTY